MAFADDLLEQAQHLARREEKRPRQASLRRAASTAYYALFHLLTAAAVANWKRADQRATLARAFEHGRMKAASERVANHKMSPFTGEDPAIVAHLRTVARAFKQLQQSRHEADYDNSRPWTRTDALAKVDAARIAFQSWRLIREQQIAQDYLLSLLIKDR